MNAHPTTWRKSSYSEANGACVEVGRPTRRTVGVRDSKQHGTGPVVEFSRPEWAEFLLKIKVFIDAN